MVYRARRTNVFKHFNCIAVCCEFVETDDTAVQRQHNKISCDAFIVENLVALKFRWMYCWLCLKFCWQFLVLVDEKRRKGALTHTHIYENHLKYGTDEHKHIHMYTPTVFTIHRYGKRFSQHFEPFLTFQCIFYIRHSLKHCPVLSVRIDSLFSLVVVVNRERAHPQ